MQQDNLQPALQEARQEAQGIGYSTEPEMRNNKQNTTEADALL